LEFALERERIVGIKTTRGDFSAEQVCLTSGAWTKKLAEKMGIYLPIKPIRGQIALLRLDEKIQQNIIHKGSHYLVPRGDGRVLVGSTMEDVGFEKKTTTKAVSQMLQFANSMFPQFEDAEVEQCWAGFRPASEDGLPFIGPLPGFSNGWVAAGHFRWGLFLSPATAVVLGQLMRGISPQIDLTDFRVDRQIVPLLQNFF
jgi:glycine oxidase